MTDPIVAIFVFLYMQLHLLLRPGRQGLALFVIQTFLGYEVLETLRFLALGRQRLRCCPQSSKNTFNPLR